MIGYFAKDATDAVAASIDLLRKYHPIAYDSWEPAHLDNLLDNAAEQSSAAARTQKFLASIGGRT